MEEIPMKVPSALLASTAFVLAACAGGQDAPPPGVAYVEATQIEPPSATVEERRMPVPITAENPIPEPKVQKFKSHEAKTAAALKGGTQSALDAEFEGVILNYQYQHGRRYRVVVDAPSAEWEQDADATTITLGQDDGSESDIIVGGDPNWFNVDKANAGIDETSMRAKRDKVRAMANGTSTTMITVKCFKPGVRTSLKIGTGQRKYIFDLQCSNRHGGSGYNQDVQFTYAYDQQISTYQPARPTQARPAPVVADTRYTVEGPDEWRPREWAAWNDGASTHIRPSPAVRSRPVPMLGAGSSFFIDPASGEYVVTGLPSEVRFPWGDAALMVRRTP
jgi:hypothetical protein